MNKFFSTAMLCLVTSMVMMAQGISGTYYLKNVGTQKYLAAGSYWGTHAIVNEVGLDFILVSANGKVTIDSQVSNGGTKHFLNGEYVDGNSFDWSFNAVGNGAYTISNGEKYLTAGADGLVTLADNASAATAQWVPVTIADRLALLNAATDENGVDASYLIKGSTFSRNDLRNSAWIRTKSGGNETVAGPSAERTSYGCEYWNNTFDIHQIIENLPNGVYEFRIAGYGTNGSTYIYANDTENAFLNTTGAANFATALDEIAAGAYTGNTTGKVAVVGNTLKIGVKRTENKKQDWAVFDDARLIYYGAVSANEYKTLYEQTLAAAKSVLEASEYAVVTGEEKTALQQAVSNNTTIANTQAAYEAAIVALKGAMDAFKNAKADYEKLIAAKTAMGDFDFTLYPYAATNRKAAVEAALSAVPSSADDARKKTEAIYLSFRQYAESSAMLESVENATNFTGYIKNPKAEQVISPTWMVINGEGSEGALDIKSNEPWTDGEGNVSHMYFDGGNWAGQSWDVSMKQDIQLPKGKFQLTVKSRASSELTTFVLFAGDAKTEMQRIGAAGGLFDRGWNDASLVFELNEPATVSIGVQGVTSTLHNWMSFSDFRLVSFDKFEGIDDGNRPPKGKAVTLKRGLMALHQSSGNLVSWRARKSDSRNYKFKLYRGTNADTQTTKVNSGNFIMGKTNFLDASGNAGYYYKLEVYDDQNRIVETEVSGPTWDGQVKYITLEGGAPTDPTSANATYTPNDASFCDMDGDGEYDIILKWAPSNEKDAASNGTTSPAFYSCYKLDGTRLWMLHTGHNMFNSAHTTPFVAWDLDGDGFGEFMVKTAPGAIDGEGKYILLDGDDPTANLKSSRGKQDHGSEYITVFDGTTGAELKTVRYHTAYGDVSTDFWGDSKQNRSERYLAGIAWLSGEDENPSAIFARGYYSGCNIGAYDWDGTNLTLRWLHRGTSANAGTVTYANGTVKNLNKSVYGEGAHSFSVGDVTGDGKQEITYGSGALNVDGATLYRTGFGHGDATHLGDFIPSRPGQEFFMAHEKSPYGVDLRDARTGEVIWRHTASGDTGRGIMAHFNSETENAYWQASDNLAMIYDTDQHTVANNVSHGGGASLNNRIYWNGTLADDFYDKSVLEYWNPTSNGFWRMQVNGGNYTYGNLNNSSKYNPCVLGDLLGDWREEIVNWQQNSNGDYQLVINATNYQTDYTFPHLMDDYAYRAQLVAENSVYNQPPHVSYDPRTVKTIVPETFVVSPSTIKAGSFWGAFYTTYPVIIPEGVCAWSVTNRVETNNIDTLKVTLLATGKIIPAGRAVIFNSTTNAPKFVPTALEANTTVSNTYVKGFYCDSLMTDANDGKYVYEFRNGDRGPGFYRTYGEKVIPGGNAFAVFGTATQPGRESYVMGFQYNAPLSTIINSCTVDGRQNNDDAIYNIMGVRLTREPAHGIYIKGGQKHVK